MEEEKGVFLQEIDAVLDDKWSFHDVNGDKEWNQMMRNDSNIVKGLERIRQQKYLVHSPDEDNEKEDLDSLPEIPTVKKNLKCSSNDWKPWNRDFPYKYIKGKKVRKERFGGEMDEATLRKCISRSKKGKSLLQKLKDKRKILFSRKEESNADENNIAKEKHQYFWSETKRNNPYHGYKDINGNESGLKRKRKHWKVSTYYDPRMEDQVLRDMDVDLKARLERLSHEKQRRVTVTSPCSMNYSELLTPIQSDDEQEEGKVTPLQEGFFTRQDRGKLFELEEKLYYQQQCELFDEITREERRRKYLHNQAMAPLAKLTINKDQIKTYYEHMSTGEDSIRLKKNHFVLHHKLPQHPWVMRGITYDKFTQEEHTRSTAAYAEYSKISEYERTMALVKKLGRRYEKMFVEYLMEAITDHWKETDKVVLDDWLHVCPLLMHGGNPKKTRRHAITNFLESDMNILFKCWLEMGPLNNELKLHHRVCQWICMLDDPTWCVSKVITQIRRLKVNKRKRVNRISSPQRLSVHQNMNYATENYERNLWERMIHEVYIRDREENIKWFTVSPTDLKAMLRPLPPPQLDRVQKYMDPVVRQVARLKSFWKEKKKSWKPETLCAHNDSSSSSNSSSSDEEEGAQRNRYNIDDQAENEDIHCNEIVAI